ncbi:MAG: hypothetical protein HC844_14620 [Tabrizicola sp.]|nr:hypothetical protein [Tabrizicola sp.]
MAEGEAVVRPAFGARDGAVTVPGPMIVVPHNDTTLTIHLDNDLPDLMPTRDGASGDPIGLVNTRRRLEALYPNAHEFSAEVGNDGRFQVRIHLPLRAAS